MGAMKTPGVYIVEKSAFPNSVVEVATAVPAFIGYTAKADNKGKSLAGKPWRISSLAEFRSYYGDAPTPKFNVKKLAAPAPPKGAKPGKETEPAPSPSFQLGADRFVLERAKGPAGGNYLLYYGMLQFFQNGGGPCYVVSVGDYSADVAAKDLTAGIDALVKEPEPTMIVIPDAVLLPPAECYNVQKAALMHCGDEKNRNRVAILDVWEGFRDRQDPAGDRVADFRLAVGTTCLDFGAAYYPWVNASILSAGDLGYENVANLEDLKKLLKSELELAGAPKDDEKQKERAQVVDSIGTLSGDDAETQVEKGLLNKSLVMMSPLFNAVLGEIKSVVNLLPPSAAMAGVYTLVDNSRGVWKAPANVSLNGVVSPAVKITHADQEDLNVPTNGKSVNAIREFIGEGTLVWGARTLDGNSLDWRYVNVRRTMIMLEQSIKIASKAFVFEKNDANTWVTMKSMIRNFLTGIWKRGGLAGASPEDAFSVHVGLGETMTPEDILEGILRITVLVAVSRPAEFIEITFQQQMQKS